MNESKRTHWLDPALQRSVVRRSLAYAGVVGAILILINHGEAILDGDVGVNRVARMGLTALVPYVVSMLASVGAMRDERNRKATQINQAKRP